MNQMCAVSVKGDGAADCEKFAMYYRSLFSLENR